GRYASAFAGTLNAANTVESCPWPDARARKYIFTTVSRPLVAVNVITGLAMYGAVEAMFRKLGSSSPAMSRCAALGTPNPERGCEALGAVASLAQAARPVSTDAAAARASSSRREEFIEVAPKQYIERGRGPSCAFAHELRLHGAGSRCSESSRIIMRLYANPRPGTLAGNFFRQPRRVRTL